MTYGRRFDDGGGPVWEEPPWGAPVWGGPTWVDVDPVRADPWWDDPPDRGRRWGRLVASVLAVAVTLGGMATAVFANGGHFPKRITATASSPAPSPIESADASQTPTDPSTESPSEPPDGPSSRASPAHSAGAPGARRSALPTAKPTFPASPARPAPTPSSNKNCTTPSHEGTDLPRAEIRGYMEQLSKTALYPKNNPDLRVSLNLMKAIAYQESGWQSSVIACDGGVGTMQMMPGTSDMMNKEFGTKLDIHQPRDNITQGAQYIAFMIKKFGSAYDPPTYNVMQNDMLLKSVISGYQAGPWAVDPTKGDAGLPNPAYVKSVRALMTNCPCLSY